MSEKQYYFTKESLDSLATLVETRFSVSGPLTIRQMIDAINQFNYDIFITGDTGSIYQNDYIQELPRRAFILTSVETVALPNIRHIPNETFKSCYALTIVSMPACTMVDDGAFQDCTALSSISFRDATGISMSAFSGCTSLHDVYLPNCNAIYARAFQGCVNLTGLYLTGSNVCMLYSSDTFLSTPIGGYSDVAGQFGSVYVPASLLSDYQSARYWSDFASRIVGI